jgi:hypothetical protein
VKHYQNLQVVYGKPIEVSDYWDAFEENGPRGMNLLKQRLAEELKPLMIHIETVEYYDMYIGLRTVFNERMREILGIGGERLHDKFIADKEMIRRLDEILEKEPHMLDQLKEKVENYMKSLDILNIRDWVVRSKGYSGAQTAWRWLTLLVTLPVFLYGLINNALVYFLPVRAVRNIKDVQFHSSVKAGLSMLVVMPLSYLLQTLLVGILTDEWYYWVGYLLLLYPTGKLALIWYLRLKKTLRGGWFGRRYRRNNKAATALVQQRKEIIDITENLIGDRHVTPNGV